MLTWEIYREWLGPVLLSPHFPKVPCPDIVSWSSDTRTIKAGEWYVPIVGAHFDGHQFIAEAKARGAAGFFYSPEKSAHLSKDLLAHGIAVRDTLEAFQKITSGWRRSLKGLTLAAVTGSSGKTTTKELLGLALSASGKTFATQASFNNEVGVPKTLQQLTPDHVYAAVEFGARMPGNIAFLCDLGQPNVAGLINVGTAHLGIFGSRENLLNTKLEIFRNSPPHAILVPSADDKGILAGAQSTGKRVLSFGYAPFSDVRIIQAEWLPQNQGMAVELLHDSQKSLLKFSVAHEALPLNAAAAMAMALGAGADRQKIEEGLVHFRGVKGRYMVHELKGITIIDDTYNANPASVTAGFQTLAKSYPQSRKILILGDMLELGPTSAEEHRQVGELGAKTLSPTLLITVGKEAKHIAYGAKSAGLEKSKVLSFETVEDLIYKKIDFTGIGDIIYAKGSNGIRLSKFIESFLKQSGEGA